MRGTREDNVFYNAVARFIPAHAGNALAVAFSAFAVAVHPRACGERYQHIADDLENRGSSPRMRGTLAVATPNTA